MYKTNFCHNLNLYNLVKSLLKIRNYLNIVLSVQYFNLTLKSKRFKSVLFTIAYMVIEVFF